MPSITFDGRSFQIDGRRVWLAGGTICPTLLPREAWADRIWKAKRSGLNTIDVPVIWSAHEARPGVFDFEGGRDLRAFLELVGHAGLMSLLRVGPFIGEGLDLGGLPPWLVETAGVRTRQANQPFLEACGRFLTALADRLRPLQATSPGGLSPIFLIESESLWTCGLDEEGEAYLGELHRYLREAGFSVPVVGNHNLWQSVEGQIDAWTGTAQMTQVMRQLSAVRPNQPRLARVPVARPMLFSRAAPEAVNPATLHRTLMEVLAGGAQFLIDPFAGVSRGGFLGGREDGPEGGFVAPADDQGAPLTEAGGRGASYEAVRRAALFSSQFGRVLAHREPAPSGAAVDPEASGRVVSVVETSGSQGGVVFVFAPPGTRDIPVLRDDGTALPMHVGESGVAWCLLDVHLGGRAQLDLCTLSAVAHLGQSLLCVGPAGTDGVVSINGSPLEVTVPSGKNPLVLEHEGVTIVIASDEQFPAIHVGDDGIYLGVRGIDAEGQPLGLEGTRKCTRIGRDGTSSSVAVVAPGTAPARAPTLSGWERAPATDYASGTSPRFATVAGPGSLATFGAPSGYGWYRATFKGASAKKVRLSAPGSGDRLHVSLDGEAVGLIGTGPASEPVLSVSLPKGKSTLVVLADNMGHSTSGIDGGPAKGLVGPLLDVKPVRVAKPTIEEGDPVRPLRLWRPLWEVRDGEQTLARRVTWTLQHRKKSALLLSIAEAPFGCVLLLNGKPARYIEAGWSGDVLTDPEQLTRGKNVIQLAPMDEGLDEAGIDRVLASAQALLRVQEIVDDLGARAEWAFARWEPPASATFSTAPKSGPHPRTPTWWRVRFEPKDPTCPLYLEMSGLTKGQLFLNGQNLARYWVATSTGKAVGPQTRYLLPAELLLASGPNEILIFDEHGGNPSRCKLRHDPTGASVLG
ncbi:MAG: beta-galactosidase [Phycisphaeraceae bacterium]|nr:beta-galactosidase [Phycisphaeraceae bacterium]